jgi:hypothetical protein
MARALQMAEMERPGLLVIQIGSRRTKGLRVFDPSPFPETTEYIDDHYVDEMIVSADDFLSDEGWNRIFREFSARITYSFNVKTEQGL